MSSHTTDATKLARQLRKEGYDVELNKRGGHWEVRRGDLRVTTFSSSPSDRRWKLNVLGDIRKWKKAHGYE